MQAIQLGRIWFQWRSFSPVPLFLMLVLLPAEFAPSVSSVTLSIVGILIAESLRIWAVGYAGSRTRTRGDRVEQLVHAGPFRYVRNPLYIANILLYSMVGVLFGFAYFSAFIFLYSCIQYHFIVAFEEDVLKSSFGSKYEKFLATVPRWIPTLSPKMESSEHRFNLLTALRSERSTFYSMTAMALLYVLKSAFIYSK